MKKILVFLLFTLLFINVYADIVGDVDGSGKVTSNDYIIVRKHILKQTTLTGDMLKRADLTKDNKITSLDYIAIRKMILNGNTQQIVTIPSESQPTNSPNPTSKVVSVTLNKSSITLAIGQKETLEATISPIDAINKKVTWSSSDKSIAEVVNGKITAKKKGNVTITVTTEDGKKKATCNIKVVNNIDYAKVLFINVHNTSKILNSLKNVEDNKDGFDGGLSIVIKSYDNKYILIDTGNKNAEIAKSIYNTLKEEQKSDNVKIDYMILTHSHSDHVGNAVDLLNNSKITISKVIMKYESKSKSIYNNVLKSLNNKEDLIEPKNEGQIISVGKYLDMYFFNTSDVYGGKECHKGYSISYNSRAKTKINGKYYYFDGSKYPKMTIKSTSEYKTKHDKIVSGIDNYYYVHVTSKLFSDCNPNGNSLAIMMKVKTDKDNSYMYFPGDIENVGATGNYFASISDIKYSSKEGTFIGQMGNTNKTLSETIAAKTIKKTLGDEIKNIKIYQASHHGLNNEQEAINTLGLNRKDLYVVMTHGTNPKDATTFSAVRSSYYTLAKTKQYHAGGAKKNGVSCSINYNGNASCKDY